MEKEWQTVLDRFTYGIYLVSIVAEQGINGMIASWVSQCSHEPPIVMVAIRKNRLSHTQIMASKKFCINVLPEDSLTLLKKFKIPDWEHKFDGIEYIFSPQGAPVLSNAIGFLDCTLERSIETGDHTMFIARVVTGGFLNDKRPLSSLDYQGVYRGNR